MQGDTLFQLTPDKELSFRRPFTSIQKESLKVASLSTSSCVAFKVKTTAPKQYCVRPNSGRLHPGQSVVVQVIMQPMRDDPPEDFKCKDKFLVQCMAIDSSLMQLDQETANARLKDLWTEREKADKLAAESGGTRLVHEIKLRVSFAQSGKKGDAEPSLSASDSQESLKSMARTIASVNERTGSGVNAEGTVNLEAQPKTIISSLTPNNPVTKPTITSHLAPSTLPPASNDSYSTLTTQASHYNAHHSSGMTGSNATANSSSQTQAASDSTVSTSGASAQVHVLEQKLAAKQKELDLLSSNVRQRNVPTSNSVTFDKRGSSQPFKEIPEAVTITGVPPKLVLVLVVLAFLFGVAFF